MVGVRIRADEGEGERERGRENHYISKCSIVSETTPHPPCMDVRFSLHPACSCIAAGWKDGCMDGWKI